MFHPVIETALRLMVLADPTLGADLAAEYLEQSDGTEGICSSAATAISLRPQKHGTNDVALVQGNVSRILFLWKQKEIIASSRAVLKCVDT